LVWENDEAHAACGIWHATYTTAANSEINVPDMSETSTWTASRRSVILSRMEASVICDIFFYGNLKAENKSKKKKQ
jgi:hypothetical protein